MADGSKLPAAGTVTALRRLLSAVGARPERLDTDNRAALAALAEEVLILREEIGELETALKTAEAQADHDVLTPLFNRRAFDRELKREIALATRHGTPLSVIFVDLDDFKPINDAFGHPTGDDVLVYVAGLLKKLTRETDIVARVGGDEFAVALPHAAREDATRKAQELSQRIGSLRVVDPDDPDAPALRVGASCGVAEWRAGMSSSDLVRRADEAMYLQKAPRSRV